MTVSRGYPYLVQAIGYCAWNASSGAAGITTAHVDRSLPEALGMYRANVLEQAWLDASPREREMLAVMAAISTTEPDKHCACHSSGFIAKEMTFHY